MKLFLSSEALSGKLSWYFTELVGKDAKDIKIALIENAADTYAEEKKDWVYENRSTLTNAGYQVELIDLREYRGKARELEENLASNDAIWINGGNTFYLNWLLEDVGASRIISKLVKGGVVYGGGSAGIIVAGPTLKYIDKADDPKDAPEVKWHGMGLIDTVVVPHVGNTEYNEVIAGIITSLENDGFRTIGITDRQAVIINDGVSKVVSQ